MIFPLCSAIAETKKSRAYGLKFQPSSNNALLGTSLLSAGKVRDEYSCEPGSLLKRASLSSSRSFK